MKLSFFTNRQYREEKVLDWTLVGLFIFVTAFIWSPSRDGLQIVFALGLLLPLLCVLPFRLPEFRFYGGWFTALALVFAAYASVTSYWAPKSKPDFFFIQWLVLAVWLCGISLLSSRRRINLAYLFELLLLLGCLLSIVSILIFYGHNSILSRLEGTFVARNPNELGVLFGVLALLAFCQWLKANSSRESLHYGLMLGCLSVPVFLSQSRGALLALILTYLMACFYFKPSKQKILFLVGLGVLCVFALVVNWEQVINIMPDRLGAGLRDIIWQEVFSRSVNEHMMFGLGLEKDGKIIVPDVDVFHHAHNVWLDTFYRTGLVGLILALVHVFYVLQKFKHSETLTPLYLWLMFGLIASMFDYRCFFWEIDFKWFLFWIPIGLISAMHIQESHTNEISSRLISGTKNEE